MLPVLAGFELVTSWRSDKPETPLRCRHCKQTTFTVYESGHLVCVACGQKHDVRARRRIYIPEDEELVQD